MSSSSSEADKGAALQPDIPPLADFSTLPRPSFYDDKKPYWNSMLLTRGAATRLTAPDGAAGQGHALLVDTFYGTRLIARFRRVPPGRYYLWIDDSMHKGRGSDCKEGTTHVANPPKTWKLGLLDFGQESLADIDVLFRGRGTARAYTVPAEPIEKKGVKHFLIQNEEFHLFGRWLRLSAVETDASRGTRRDVLCGRLENILSRGWKIDFLPGHELAGGIVFEWDDFNRTTMKLNLKGASPNHAYRLVVHQWEDCSDPVNASMGAAYAPEENKKVSYPNYRWPLKKGDLGTFKADSHGALDGQRLFLHPMTEGSPATIWGRSIVIYQLPADKHAAPSTPIPVACGKIIDL